MHAKTASRDGRNCGAVMKFSVLAFALGAALLSHVLPASAAMIGVTYKCDVTQGGGPVSSGETVTFDVRVDDSIPPFSSSSIGASYDAVTQFNGTFSGGFAFTSITGMPFANGISVSRFPGEHIVTITGTFQPFGVGFATATIGFDDQTATMLQSTAIPNNLASLLSLSQSHGFSLLFTIGGGQAIVLGTLTAASAITTTPIPAALPLFASALGGLGFMGWKRRRTA